MAGIFVMILIIVLAAAVLEWYQRRKMYRQVDKMLEQVLNRERIEISDIQEGEISALASKMIRVQEKLEYELNSAQEEKEQVKSLISNMSHQLKTPLSSVIMYRDLLEMETERDQRQYFLDKMKLQLGKIDWILKSLFKMVRLEQGAIQFETGRISLKDTLLIALNSIYDQAEKKEICIVTEPFSDCMLLHNKKWTAEVFVNILENAIKYSEKGSTIEIKVYPLELFTEIRFQDYGIGIRKDELTNIFQRFYRSKDVENKEGSGIGLYLSRLILDQEKGYMTVSSDYGKGSCFSVFLQNCQN